MEVQLAGDKMARWVTKMMEGAETTQDKAERIAMGALRANMVPELKMYLDLAKPTTKPEFDAVIDQWVKAQPYKRSVYKQQSGYRSGDSYKFRQENNNNPYNSANRRPVTCYSCGKVGHMSKEYRSKPLQVQKQTSTNTAPVDTKPIVCFTCSELGHKSPQCPKRRKDKVKRVSIPREKIERLADNDIMATLGGVRLPMTFDSGAQISVVPIELVRSDEMTGETTNYRGAFTNNEWLVGIVANVSIKVGDELFRSRAIAAPGEQMEWTALLRIDMKDRDMLTKVNTMITQKDQLQEADLHYLPPRVIDGHVQGAVMVSEGEVVEETEQCIVEEQVETSENPPVAREECARVEADDAEVSGEVLAGTADLPSVVVEGEGDAQGGST